ncbi:hypothetical protein B0T19DRAFT_32964 [Cercophora scortea]|uniref:Transmembrane protein n=1 Tax=Cercophora scortea TaxID=314031 RepID=A0AAE0J3J2_9PEZI|nr:hypothetical protein B0T19DRAFT_32964 [Cercophora scortea]
MRKTRNLVLSGASVQIRPATDLFLSFLPCNYFLFASFVFRTAPLRMRLESAVVSFPFSCSDVYVTQILPHFQLKTQHTHETGSLKKSQSRATGSTNRTLLSREYMSFFIYLSVYLAIIYYISARGISSHSRFVFHIKTEKEKHTCFFASRGATHSLPGETMIWKRKGI